MLWNYKENKRGLRMIIFSDLDRSLIYSKKFISGKKDIVNVEIYNNEEISFMSKRTIDLLKELMLKKKVIPTTTRNIEQYKRIMFEENNINFDIAIVCNGGCILKDGILLEKWNNIIREKLKECTPFNEVKKEFIKYKDIKGILKVRDVYDMFFYLVIDRSTFFIEKLKEFKEYLSESNWDMHINGRKIYFIPSVIRKEYAVKFIKEYFNIQKTCAIGDSTMDLGMLNAVDTSFIPKGSSICSYEVKSKVIISENEGIKGSEEILSHILKKVQP